MIKCKYCGAELSDEVMYCSTCGARIETGKESPKSAEPVQNVAAGTKVKKEKRPINGGQLAWSIVNISTGTLSCCFFVPFISFILGIVALIYTSDATSSATEAEERGKIKIARILNIIASTLTLLSFVVYIGIIVVTIFASGDAEDFMRFRYYFD